MKKNLLSLLLVTFAFSVFSQHKTEFNSSGDPQSEIIDSDNMKQGVWTFYNSSDKVVRKEVYSDNQLISRVSLIEGEMTSTLEYRSIPLYDSLIEELRAIDPNCKGEFILNDSGEILEIHFYHTVLSGKALILQEKIKTQYHSNFTNVIVNF
jgi:antitoxin component YwqK of YwqJK toxin-antitoxin module